MDLPLAVLPSREGLKAEILRIRGDREGAREQAEKALTDPAARPAGLAVLALLAAERGEKEKARGYLRELERSERPVIMTLIPEVVREAVER